METPCKPLAEAPSAPLLQDQYWRYVVNAHRDMAPEDLQEFLGAMGPPPQVLQLRGPPSRLRLLCSSLDSPPDTFLQPPPRNSCSLRTPPKLPGALLPHI